MIWVALTGSSPGTRSTLDSRLFSTHVLNIKNPQVVSMCESSGETSQLPCDLSELGEDRAITRGLMRLSERALASLLENEPDIYTVEDLKVRFR